VRPSALELLEQGRLEVVCADPPRAGDERLDLAPADEAPAAQLDALELAGPRPRPDRLGPEPDVHRFEDLAGLGEGDPVGCRRRHQSLVDPAGAEPLSDELLPDELLPDELLPDELPESPPESLELDPLSPLDPLFAVSSFFDEDERLEPLLELERSFFAQPVPLKWIVGGAKAFVIVPSAPHSGQNLGPGSLIPWTTSVRWPQLLQT